MNQNHKKLQPGVSFSEMPGVREALETARSRQFVTRENSLLNLTYDLCGFKVRTMTVSDYVLLERSQSPFILRREPDMEALAKFLWILSPRFYQWNGERWFSFLHSVAAFFHGRKVARKFGKNIPESSELVVVAAFDYIDTMFFDSPASLAKGQESCLSYLTGWFDAMQSEYHFTSEQVWQMGLPELFQRLKAMQRRYNPSMPSFNKLQDSVTLFVIRGLRSKEFTLEDLKAGRVKVPIQFCRN